MCDAMPVGKTNCHRSLFLFDLISRLMLANVNTLYVYSGAQKVCTSHHVTLTARRIAHGQ